MPTSFVTLLLPLMAFLPLHPAVWPSSAVSAIVLASATATSAVAIHFGYTAYTPTLAIIVQAN